MVKVLMYMTCWKRLKELFLFNVLEWLLKGDPAEAYSCLNRILKIMESFLILTKDIASGKAHMLQFGRKTSGECPGTGIVSQNHGIFSRLN